MDTDPAGRLDYRSGVAAAGDDVHALHRSLQTWMLLVVVWTVGVGVWVVYLAALGYAVVWLLG